VDVDEGQVRRLHAKERMAAAASKADHREVQAMAAAVRRCGGFAVALCFARALTKAVDSVLQRPLAPLLGWLIMLGRGCFFHSRAVHSLVPSHTVAKHTGFKVSRPCYGCFMMSGSDDIFHSKS
jgi:hypothetical protein